MTNEMKKVPELRFPEFDGEWEEEKIKSIFKVVSGSTPLRSKKEYFDKAEVPWVKTTDLNNNVLRITDEKISNIAVKEVNMRILPKNTLLIAMYGGFNQIGRTGVISFDSTINQAISALLDIEGKSDVKFLQAYFNFNVKKWRRVAASSRKDPNITKKDIEDFKITIPSLNEQKILGEFFSKLDRQIELEEQKLAKLEEQKKGYMQKIFSQELRFKDENGNEYPEWEEKEINSVLEKIIDNRGKTPENNATEIYPMLEVNSLGNYYPKYKKVAKFVSEETYKSWFREHIKLNDVLFSTVGNTGLVSLMDNNKAVIAQNIVGLRINSENDATFLYYLLSCWENQKKVKQIQMGAVQPSVKVSQFKYLKFYFPTKDEQQEIGVFLTIFDKIFEEQSKKIEILKARKQGLLQKMFV